MDAHLRQRYLEALGVSEDAVGCSKLRAALGRAHEIRKFEIDLYWKRAAYFWALQLAAFTGFGVLWREVHLSMRMFSLVFAVIGAITACAGWLSARGSKFWQENWEKHIDCLEGLFDGNIHKTIWIGSKGVQFSVSRLNERLNLILFIFWCAIVVATNAYVVYTVWNFKNQTPSWALSIIGVIVILLAGIVALCSLFCTRSDLSGVIYREGTNRDWQPFGGKEGKKYSILRRYGPGETSETIF